MDPTPFRFATPSQGWGTGPGVPEYSLGSHARRGVCGHGDPAQCERAHIEADVEGGYVTPEGRAPRLRLRAGPGRQRVVTASV